MEQGASLALVLVVAANVVAVIVAAQITKRKGRGPWPGFVLGAFLGWIGVLIAWLLSTRVPSTAPSPAPAVPEPKPAAASGGAASPFLGLDHVQVAVPAGREFDARRFYGGLLGLPEVEKPAALRDRGGCWFSVGPQQLHAGAVADGHVPATKAHPALLVASTRELHELGDRLAAAGYDVAWADAGELPGTERFHVADPFGNRLELLARPSGPQGPAAAGR